MNRRSKVAVIATIVVIVAGAGAFYLVSPLIISTKVDDPLPTGAVQSESYQRFISMSEEEKMQAARQMNAEERDEIMYSAAQVNNSINEPMNQILIQEEQQRPLDVTNTTNVLRTGSFLGVGDGIHNAEGTAKVIPLQDGSSILRLENLHVTNGPDLYVYLSPDKSAEDIVNIGKLKANNGNQNYEIPEGTDLSKYYTVLIWCRPFSVLFGSAELSGTT
jgi:Electron transfer DM13